MSQGSLARAFLLFPPIDLPLSKLPALCLASCFLPGAQQYAQMSIKDMAIQGVFNFFLQFSLVFPLFSSGSQEGMNATLLVLSEMHLLPCG